MLTTARCSVLELGLELVFGWLVVMHTYLYYFPLTLSPSQCLKLLHVMRLNSLMWEYGVVLQPRPPPSPSSTVGPHPRAPSMRSPRPATPSAKKSTPTVGGLVLGEVGIGGGQVEDGSAWSMVARFVCNVPGCGASFTRKQNLQRHQTQKHGRPKTVSRTGVDEYQDEDDLDDDVYGRMTSAMF